MTATALNNPAWDQALIQSPKRTSRSPNPRSKRPDVPFARRALPAHRHRRRRSTLDDGLFSERESLIHDRESLADGAGRAGGGQGDALERHHLSRLPSSSPAMTRTWSPTSSKASPVSRNRSNSGRSFPLWQRRSAFPHSSRLSALSGIFEFGGPAASDATSGAASPGRRTGRGRLRPATRWAPAMTWAPEPAVRLGRESSRFGRRGSRACGCEGPGTCGSRVRRSARAVRRGPPA